ncbi:PepSY domain-containing protein [Pseudomonas sp. GD03858]|uniref:PepSY-associated TM helix domain-containing protein n=1 Tax=unclassified Pseudomonas TaxID=196821 RepID=UPI00244B465E|nr:MULTISPECIES: PepSY-associated TM helix domain-containing protein [unclassified Pseudomonas]MDH0646624.1 PepSY domain-containing protein [Pseudomonas sp. GD03867]MDH0662340.1 PepSY domain-containing protein [Pseudomonas sp. GD03858]
MKEGLRQAMAWLHTWTGLIFGWLLFAIFLTGTLSYFKDEISHWTQPEVQFHPLDPVASLGMAQRYLEANAGHASTWFIRLPSERDAALGVTWRDPNGVGRAAFTNKALDARSGEAVEARDTRGGEFFYRFHFQLQMPHPWGRWLSTFCAFIMLLGLVTGIITHKKIFKEFFTFRPGKGQRSWLDGHNAIGVLVLPFHLMISYSSLVIFMYMVMPAGILASYGDSDGYFNDLFGRDEVVSAAAQPAPLVPLTELYAKVQAHAPGARMGFIQVLNPGDRNARVNFSWTPADSVAYSRSATWTFDGSSGALLQQGTPESAAMKTSFTLVGLHMGNFAGPWLRWLYFVFGVAGTAVIGTGLVMWLGKRQLKHAKSARMPGELRLVEVLNIAGMSGLLLGVAAFFWTNRLLPVGLEGRADWEIDAFFLAWGLSLLHAMLRPGRRAWGEQLLLGALAFALLPLLNALTTGKGLDHSIATGDWVMAGFDLTALATGLFLAWAAGKMLRAPKPAPKRAPRAVKTVEAS